jgi:hypothetical protein
MIVAVGVNSYGRRDLLAMTTGDSKSDIRYQTSTHGSARGGLSPARDVLPKAVAGGERGSCRVGRDGIVSPTRDAILSSLTAGASQRRHAPESSGAAPGARSVEYKAAVSPGLYVGFRLGAGPIS